MNYKYDEPADDEDQLDALVEGIFSDSDWAAEAQAELAAERRNERYFEEGR